jgi:hypothetical protein
MAYFILANLYQRLGNPERASEYARLAERAAESGGGEQ